MEGEMKVFRVSGEMMLSHDSFPEWRRFTVYVRALKAPDAVEKVLSDLGSRHKVRRAHIRIRSVDEVNLDEVNDVRIKALSQLTRVM